MGIEADAGEAASARRRFLPETATEDAARLVTTRGLRAVADGLVSVILPVYLLEIGLSRWQIGAIVTATLIGSAALTLLLGMVAHRFRRRNLLMAAAAMMTMTGLAFAGLEQFWPLVVVAFFGTINPSAGDVSVFLPLEQAVLSQSVSAKERTALFARYSLVGSLAGAIGALAAGLPEVLSRGLDMSLRSALQLGFLLYAGVGLVALLIYRNLTPGIELPEGSKPSALGPSKGIVYRLAALFCVDSFASGLVVQSLLALWLFDRFGLSTATAGTIFFVTGILTASSQLVAPILARRFGLINTMVFTHLPANVFLMLTPFMPNLWLALACLFARSALSQMDVPARTSYVMAVVTPEERAAASSVTSVPKSLASAASPAVAGWLFSLSGFGWPLLIAGALKATYDLLLLAGFSRVRPPEEA